MSTTAVKTFVGLVHATTSALVSRQLCRIDSLPSLPCHDSGLEDDRSQLISHQRENNLRLEVAFSSAWHTITVRGDVGAERRKYEKYVNIYV